jgi:hypothetical protein
MFCSVKVNCTWYRKLPDPDMADTRTSMEATSSQTPGAALALTAGTLPQDHQRGTEANSPYTPRLTKLPESWRHRDRTTGAHWVWVEAIVTREPGWYTQEAGRWRRYTGYDATLPSAPGHGQARAGQSGIHYDSLTGSFWTWYDAGMDYQAGWWMKAEDVWIKYDPGLTPGHNPVTCKLHAGYIQYARGSHPWYTHSHPGNTEDMQGGYQPQVTPGLYPGDIRLTPWLHTMHRPVTPGLHPRCVQQHAGGAHITPKLHK